MKRGQAAMEYLAVIGFALLMIVPIIFIFFSQSEDITQQLTMNQIREIGRKVVNTAEKIYYLGEPSQTTLKIYMPNNVEEVNINGRTIVFKIRLNNAPSDLVFPSTVNLTGNISVQSGIRFIKVKTVAGKVNISDA
ncbi:MAG: hypothetical protein V1735_07845 [Nanoarchaeota archaeon]